MIAKRVKRIEDSPANRAGARTIKILFPTTHELESCIEEAKQIEKELSKCPKYWLAPVKEWLLS